ncbi:MAG: hypothetical protein HQL84_10790 [Magnetococcales bacterium]|nr:hypothetical protein [Magnetococcales bacterium]MBF0150519.1 hypothetical protein [Magnetococcales bacterium]
MNTINSSYPSDATLRQKMVFEFFMWLKTPDPEVVDQREKRTADLLGPYTTKTANKLDNTG